MTRALKLSALASVLAMALAPVPAASQDAEAYSTRAPRAYMVDGETGAILFAKSENQEFAPASLTKIMTAETVFHALKEGKASEETLFKVTEHAWRTGGAPSGTATMFAAVNSEVSVSNLLLGLMVIYANDASIALAEGLDGSEAAFAENMNRRAGELGLAQSHFANPTGFTAEGQRTSARDMTLLARHLWQSHPVLFSRFGLPDFTWNKIFQRNKNPLYNLDIGADGLVAGYDESDGYSIVASAERNGRRLFLTLSGLERPSHRIEEAKSMLEWGMDAFRKVELFARDDIVGQASVFGGEKSRIGLVARGPVSILVPNSGAEDFTARIVYQGPVQAPVEAGAQIARFVVFDDKFIVSEVPLFAAEAVGTGSIIQRAWGALYELAFGWLRGLLARLNATGD